MEIKRMVGSGGVVWIWGLGVFGRWNSRGKGFEIGVCLEVVWRSR